MRCPRAQQRLMAYHDSELSAGAGRRLEKHLESCDECRQLLENLRLADLHASQSEGINPVVGVPDMPSPDDKYWDSFTARVLDRVEEDAATRAPDRKRPRRSWGLFIPRMVPAFSVALVVVVAAGVLMKMGDPTPVIKAPAPSTESARDTGALEKEALPVKAEIVETESKTDTSAEMSRRAALDKSAEADEAFRPVPSAVSTPLPVPKPETSPEPASTEVSVKTAQAKVSEEKPVSRPAEITAQSEIYETAVRPRKKTALAASMEAEKAGEAEIAAAPVPVKETVPAAVESDAVSPVVVAEIDADILPETAGKSAAGPSPETFADSTPAASERITADQPGETSFAAAGVQRPLEESAVIKKDPEQEIAVAEAAPVPSAPSADPVIPGYNAGTDLGNEMEVADIMVPSLTGKTEPTAPEMPEPPLAEPEILAEAGVLNDAPDIAEGKASVVSGIETLDSVPPVKEARQSFGSSLPYRGPEDQLIHAKRLAEVRKFWESEQVLKDLISQKPPVPIQEEASILLVRVLSSQNRVGEAQQTLDDAKIQFPSNDMIQTFELNTEGGRPVQ